MLSLKQPFIVDWMEWPAAAKRYVMRVFERALSACNPKEHICNN